MSDFIDIVFDSWPMDPSEDGRFVEVEDATRHSISHGEWVRRDDGYVVLRIPSQAAEIQALRDRVAELEKDASEARDTADLLDFYFNHHINAGGRRRWLVESPLGRQWVLLEDVKHHSAMHAQYYGSVFDRIEPEWRMIDGSGERNDFPKVEDAIREARRRSSGIWDVPEDDEDEEANQ